MKYDIDNRGTKFQGYDKNARCFVAEHSWADAEWLMDSCGERYIIDFKNSLHIWDEHSYVRGVYNEIIKHPFFGKYFSLFDTRTAERWERLEDRDLSGKIFVDDTSITNLKYLEVSKKLNRRDKNKYFLIGNSKNNTIDCKEDNSTCYGLSYGGSDVFWYNKYMQGMTVADDFNKNEGDTILIESNGGVVINKSDIMPWPGGYVRFTLKYINGEPTDRYVYIRGVSMGDVEEWLKIADPKTKVYVDPKGKVYVGKDLLDKKSNNPIQIE